MTIPVRLGLVGLNFGMTVCRELVSKPECPVKLAKVCDLDPARAQPASEELGVPTAPSLDALLDDPEIDAIGLYCGPVGRADLVRKIIRAGKDVMTTKPFEIDAAAALAVLHEARDLGRVVHLNSPNPRPYGENAIIKEWIDAGLIGRPTMANCNTWVYYGAVPADGTWYDDPVRCPVAPVFRIGIYAINLLLSIFSDPEEVHVFHARIETGRPTPDNASLTIKFKDGAIANVMSSFVIGCDYDRYRGGTTIGGTKGTIYHGTGPGSRTPQPLADLILSTNERLEYRTVKGHSGDYDWDFFAQRVRGEIKNDVTTPEQIVNAIRVVNAMAESEQTGQPARIA